MTKKIRLLLNYFLVFFSLNCIAFSAFAQNVAIVNGTAIPIQQERALIEELVRQGRVDDSELRYAVKEELISRQVLMQAALRDGVANRPHVKAKIALANQNIIVQSWLEAYLKKNVPTEEMLQTEYDQLKKQLGNQTHIAFPPFEEIKPQLQQEWQQKQLLELEKQLRDKAKIQ